jgi:hypothetical protein
MYDVVGDIHGQARELEALLAKLGYKCEDGCYSHQNRKVIFLGDFIDRGNHQREVINIVRPMIDTGAAFAVMGNHEFNAIAYYTQTGNGSYLRPRNSKNTLQHQAFLKEYQDDPEGWGDVIDWFKTLPLWLELDDIRVVHACWEGMYVERILELQNGSNLLGDELLHAASDRDKWQYKAVETLLKGVEVPLPLGYSFEDKDGIRRYDIRVRWWDMGKTYRQCYMGPEEFRDEIPDTPISSSDKVQYSASDKPVFLGHYWMSGQPTLLTDNIVCVDYSVAKSGGKLVAYRWDGEATLDSAKFVSVGRIS